MKQLHSLKVRAMAVLLIVACSLAVQTVKATNISVSGTISAPTTWSADTVKVTGDLQINSGITLTINPGVKVIFQGHYKLEVKGKVLAVGTSSMPIDFTVRDTTGFTNMTIPGGGWSGIRFDSTLAVNDTSKFTYCRFSYGKANGSGDMVYGGALYIYYFDKVRIQQCSFTNCRASNDGGAICVKNATAFISANTFMNGSSSRGAGVYCENAYPRIERNTFTGNYASYMGGGICVSSSAAPSIVDNLLYTNLAYLGGAISFFNAGVMTRVTSNTLVHNRANYGGGISSIASDATLTNNIIWGNEAAGGLQVTLLDTDSDPNFTYCDIQGGVAGFGGSGAGAAYSGTYTNNLNAYPQFADTLIADYQIKTASPCLDAGTPDTTGLHLPAFDVAGSARINMGRIDIGAYERQQVVTFCGNITQNTLWNADTVKVNCDITVAAGATLSIAPGVYVEMQDNYKITVLGLLKAIGTSSENITFTPKDHLEGWKGISFKLPGSASDSSRLKYCTIENVYNLSSGTDGALILDSVSKVSIQNCIIHDNSGKNGAAISLEHSSPLIANCTIHDNDAHPSLGNGGAICAITGSAPKLRNLIIYNNAAATGGGLYIESGYLQAANLFISNNSSDYGGGMAIDTSLVLFTNTIIVNNSSNIYGGGVYSTRSDVTINNSTIANNMNQGDGAAMAIGKTTAKFNNTILYGNKNNSSVNKELYIADTFCTSTFKFCDVEGDTTQFSFAAGVDFEGTYNNNLDVTPGFVTPTAGAGGSFYGVTADWSLDPCSPLFNAGNPNLAGLYMISTDYANNARVYADTIDMGAYELIKPYITLQPHDTAICANNAAYFSIDIESSIGVNFQWQIKPAGMGTFSNASGPGASTSTYTVSSATAIMNGDQYRCIVSGNCSNDATSSVATLIVNVAPTLTGQPSAVSVCQNGSATFSTTATGSNLSYQWQQRPFGSATWSNCIGSTATTANYNIPSVPSALNNYSYRCIVNGSCVPGDTTIVVDLTVKSLPSVVTNPSNQSICAGQDASFTVSGSGTGISYLWQISTDGGLTWNSTGQTGTTLSITGVTIAMNGNKYRCVISGDCSPAANSSAATLTVNLAPAITSQPENTGACVYSTVSIPLVATGGNLTFQWEQKAPGDLVWSNAPGMSALTATYQLVNVSLLMDGTKYRCQISGSCAPATTSDSVVLSVYNLPSFYVGPDVSMLLSHTIQLDAGAGYSGYLWSTTEVTQVINVVGTDVGIGTHAYSCTVTDAHGCQNNDGLVVTVLDDAGIENAASSESIKVYPNPANDKVVISFKDNTLTNIDLRVLNLLGETVIQSVIENSGKQIELDVTKLSAGTYILHLWSGDQSLVQRFTIER